MPNEALVEELARRRAEMPRSERRRQRKVPRWRFPDNIMQDYRRMIQRDLREMRDEIQQEITTNRLQLWLEEAGTRVDATRADGWASRLRDILASVEARMPSEDSYTRDTQRVAADISTFNRGQERRIFQSVLGVDPSREEPWLGAALEGWARNNARLIKTLQGDFVNDVAGEVTRGIGQGKSASDIGGSISRRYGVSFRRGRMIARNEVGNLNAELTERRQKDAGIEEFKWSASGDERVREEHDKRDGNKYLWSSPPDGEIPGEPINCRCVALPVFDDIITEADKRAGIA